MMFSMAIRYDPAADECSEPGLLLPPLLTPAATAWPLKTDSLAVMVWSLRRSGGRSLDDVLSWV